MGKDRSTRLGGAGGLPHELLQLLARAAACQPRGATSLTLCVGIVHATGLWWWQVDFAAPEGAGLVSDPASPDTLVVLDAATADALVATGRRPASGLLEVRGRPDGLRRMSQLLRGGAA